MTEIVSKKKINRNVDICESKIINFCSASVKVVWTFNQVVYFRSFQVLITNINKNVHAEFGAMN